MQLEFTEDERAFREEVRGFIRDSLPKDIQARVRRGFAQTPIEDNVAWMKILHRRGWIAPNWPVEHGGTGWSAVQRYIFEEEQAAADCPRISPFGLTMVGPVIYTFGDDGQKRRFLPKILATDELWCQGYSEPGAGSDLASLKTRAVRDGDDYVVNGQKIWTSHAHHADWMFCLVRTDPAAKPQAGISFLLVDMRSPGVTVRPIITIDGHHYLNEVFFDDVRVPLACRVGEENKGWTYAKFLLNHERTAIANVGRSKQRLEQLKRIARTEQAYGEPLIREALFGRKLAELEVQVRALELTNLRLLAARHEAGAESSILKLRGSEVEQRLNELMVEALGYYALPYQHEAIQPLRNAPRLAPDHADGVMPEHLFRRAATIYGGSSEVQKNVIAKMVLGL